MIVFLKGCLVIVAIDKIISADGLKIINTLINKGAQVYLVGGAIRDYLIDYPINDIDLEVYHLEYSDLKEILKDYSFYANDTFQTIKINNIEIALPRLEEKVGLNYTDYQLTFNPNLSLEQATSRRDFTINSLMYCFNNQELYDLHDGLSDLKNGVLRMVNPTKYQEDSIRVLRLLKYQSRYNFKIEKDTLIASKLMALKIWAQPPTLVASYFQDIITNKNLDLFIFFDVLSKFLLVPSLKNKISRNIHHPEKSLFKHIIGSLLCLQLLEIDNKRDQRILFIALLFHDYGKLVSSKEHVQRGLEFFKTYQDYFVGKEKERKIIEMLIEDHMHIREYAQADNLIKMKELMNKYQNQFYLLEIIGICDYSGRVIDYNKEEYKQRINKFREEVISKYRRIK